MGKRRNAGFTLAEALVAVALLAIVATLAFVEATRYIRGFYHREVDEIAKELYLAAEYHLAQAQSEGALVGIPEGRRGTSDPNAQDEDGNEIEGVYYYVVGNSGSEDLTGNSMLATMLPAGAIDETVRTGGSYVIRYQYLDGEAAVLDVFYASPAGRFGRYGHVFSAGEYDALFYNPGYTGVDKYDEREKYVAGDSSDLVIGWYDGGDGSSPATRIAVPRITVTNAERLTLHVQNWREFANLAGTAVADGTELMLSIEGKTSKAKATISTKASTFFAVALDNALNENALFFDIDSIVDENGHFAQLAKRASESSGTFIPGENITVQVTARTTADSVTHSSRSVKLTTNSLFAGIDEQEGVTDAYTARISNIRHLANIGENISGFTRGTEDLAGGKGLAIDDFRQTANLSWMDFRQRVCGLTSTDTASMAQTKREAAEQVRVFDKAGVAANASKAGSFMPANPSGAIDYEGDSYQISDLVVDNASNAGIFGSLAQGSAVSDLKLVNFDIATTNGNAGALVGAATGTTIKNVGAYNDVAALTAADATVTDDSGLEIFGTTAAGGLVGSLAGASTVDGCFASVYVRPPADATGAINAAGGLVGSFVGSGGASLKHSYAGGHTGSVWIDQNADGVATNNEYIGGQYLTDTTGAGGFNVIGDGGAGGLVGLAINVSISHCYATTSVSSNAQSGGFAGVLQGGGVENCYSTGASYSPVLAGRGAFAGASYETTFNANRYLEATNEYWLSSDTTEGNWAYLPAVGGAAPGISGILPLDADFDSYERAEGDADRYNAFVRGRSAYPTSEQKASGSYAGRAVAYDAFYTDVDTYPTTATGVYPFKTIDELDPDAKVTEGQASGAASGADGQGAGASAPVGDEERPTVASLLASHYGDWPSPETLTVNSQRSMSDVTTGE